MAECISGYIVVKSATALAIVAIPVASSLNVMVVPYVPLCRDGRFGTFIPGLSSPCCSAVILTLVP